MTTTIHTDAVDLEADLTVPEGAKLVVVFAHGSGSNRHSSRNQAVAKTLNDRGLATLLMNLLTAEEATTDNRTHEFRFDIPRLGRRVVGAIDWLGEQDGTRGLKVGLFGASTGSAAAMVAASQRRTIVTRVISRGGRPDLAGDALGQVRALVLLIVGSNDPAVLEHNKGVLPHLNRDSQLQEIEGAGHLFEGPGELDRVADLAAAWFLDGA